MNKYFLIGGAILILLLSVLYFVIDAPKDVSEVIPDSPVVVPEQTEETPESIDVKVALIALEDNGQSGKMIGCNDSVVLISQEITPYTTGTLKAALTRLLSLKEEFYGESGLYNAIYQSDLTLTDVSIEGGVATVELEGAPMLGGVCDTPRFEAQLEETVLQFENVTSAEIFLNGEPLAEALSQM